MKKTSLMTVLAVVFVGLFTNACARRQAPVATLADATAVPSTEQEATQALQVLGADVEGSSHRCSECHNLNIYSIKKWRDVTQQIEWSCLNNVDSDGTFSDTDPQAPANAVNCLRVDPRDPTSGFSPAKLGLYAAVAGSKRFENIFKKGLPADQWQAQYKAFKTAVQMPISGANLMTEADFEAVLAWFNHGLPLLETLVGKPGNPPTQCQEEYSSALTDHIDRLKLTGWAAKNRDVGMHMFACPDSADPLACFAQKAADGHDLFPEAQTTEYGKVWTAALPSAKLRVLRELGFSTSFWMRSSPDGRFVATGKGDAGEGDDGATYGANISDLQANLAGQPDRDIKVKAMYDPEFFPDASGFMFQGTDRGAGFCRMSILEDPATTAINFSEPQCAGSDTIGLYEAVGASLNGGDYLAISGEFASDPGDGGLGDERPYWMERTYLQLTPLIQDGQAYKPLATTELWTPYLGDWNVAPSNELLVARIAGLDKDNQPTPMGYRIQLLDKVQTDSGYDFKMEPAATLCIKGAKGKFSYDERLFVNYHYASADDYQELGYSRPDDPALLEALKKGMADIYLTDLLTGKHLRVTNMAPGQFATFPHFRSDGWLYFMVYDANVNKRYVVASDAGIRLEQAP